MLPVLSTSRRRAAPKVCGVCGDKAKSFHFGGLSCDSCKAFFRRSVQNDAFKGFRCSFGARCRIGVSSRKSCQSCRFHKCISIGMETAWVMSEEERMRLLRTRMQKRETRQPQHTEVMKPVSSASFTSSKNDDGDFSDREIRDIRKAVDAFRHVFKDTHAFAFSREYSKVLMVTTFVMSVRQIIQFAQSLDGFSRLPFEDQVSLLRATSFEIFLVLHAYAVFRCPNAFGTVSSSTCDNVMISKDCSVSKEEPSLRRSGCPFLAERSHVDEGRGGNEASFRLAFQLRTLLPDTTAIVLFLLVILFRPEAPKLLKPEIVESHQLHSLNLLRKHMQWKNLGSVHFARLLVTLPDIRELHERHSSCHLGFDNIEIPLCS